jgi:FAD:protein FMN transferase
VPGRSVDSQPVDASAWEWKATGTTWRIHHSGRVPETLANQAAAFVEADEARWSRFRPTSELSYLNTCAGVPVETSAETFALISAADAWRERTGGLFEPLVGGALIRLGYSRSINDAPLGGGALPDPAPVNHDPLVFDARRRIVVVPRGCLLDLGGIAKTWIAIRLAALLVDGCDDPRLLVDAGGDMVAARGEHAVGVGDPTAETNPPIAQIHLAEGYGVATSGYNRRRWQTSDGETAFHIIDPDTGRSPRPAQATVVADDPLRAEVTAKVLVLRPGMVDTLADPALVCIDQQRHPSPSWASVLEPGGTLTT